MGQDIDKSKLVEKRIYSEEEFKSKIKHATDIKLKTYLDKAKELSNIDLPLCHYYEYGGSQSPPPEGRGLSCEA